jgi:hypothetical protein
MKEILAVLTLLLVGLGAGQTVPGSEGLQSFKQAYNDQTDEVPGFVGDIVGGERVNFRVETNSTNQTIGVAFEGVEISNVTEEGFEDPTLEVSTDQDTITAVVNSEDKYQVLQAELEEGDIEYQANTVGAGVKITIMDTLKGIADFLGLEF